MTNLNTVYPLEDSNGKAFVEYYTDGSQVLVSYFTNILLKTAEGRLVRLWDGWTATTGRHIKTFCGLNKKQFLELPKE